VYLINGNPVGRGLTVVVVNIEIISHPQMDTSTSRADMIDQLDEVATNSDSGTLRI
jgi:hypothetical protein